MRKYFLIPVLAASLFSCKKEEKPKEPVMVKQSEMSALMLQIYEENAALKQKILNGEDIAKYSKDYEKIHTAVLTDPNDRTPQFNAFSDIFLSNQKIVFETDQDSLKEKFNQTVNSCIACHQVSCPGPIPRIKKLYIK